MADPTPKMFLLHSTVMWLDSADEAIRMKQDVALARAQERSVPLSKVHRRVMRKGNNLFVRWTYEA